ncbi:MAG: glycosyltransferase, partial [Flavobacteriaceae bacterium]|nr:glycosyltransferase [Flavobacteriaceae bacterium]
MRIRILRIMHRINIGGPTHHAGYLTKYLNNDEFETLLISGIINKDEESGEHILNEIGVKVEYVKNMGRSINLLKDIKSYFEIKGIIKKFRPHIVHTHAAKSGTLGRLAAISENIPLIIHTFHGHVFHSYFGKFKTKIYLLIERYLAKKSDKIIAIS